jgi:2-succinyl-5-enolpyruvyl-6-hydroxy-3-cyclohexene-1-carboxylate synthase
MGNIDRASGLIAAVRAAGAQEFCVCAGSRNSPLLAVLGASDARLFSFVDERSAAFFAIGRAKLHGKPVAVVTTSGTAVAEMLPAAIEAHYSGIPLILISADRPKRYRGTGAPQSIEQVGIFGVYAETELERWMGRRPLHLNIEFDEPLIDTTVDARRVLECGGKAAALARPLVPRERTSQSGGFAAALQNGQNDRPFGKRPLVILGGLAPHHHERVRTFVQHLNAPVYAEPLSGLREDPTLPLITAGERLLARYNCDSVIRIGNVPTLRFWRDLEDNDLPVTHFSDLPFTGLTRGDLHPIETLPELDGTRDEAFFALDRGFAAKTKAILDDEPESELSMLRQLSRELNDGSRVYLGNSLPIREWDLVAAREPRGLTYEANRGANGIDGQLSTFFGWCDPARDNVCVVGDLTAIYDLGAPWIVPQLGATRCRIVIVNNGGGRIFGRVASLRALDAGVRERIIENVHGVRFEHWAAMWGIDVTELRPDAEASRRVWQRYDALWS